MILQTTYVDGSRHFQSLGDHFCYEDRYMSKDRFKETAEVHFGKRLLSEIPADCIAFIIYDSGRQITPLHTCNRYDVIGDNGTVIKRFHHD